MSKIRVQVAIEFNGDTFQIDLSKDSVSQRAPNGAILLVDRSLRDVWDKACDDAEAWVCARQPRREGD